MGTKTRQSKVLQHRCQHPAVFFCLKLAGTRGDGSLGWHWSFSSLSRAGHKDAQPEVVIIAILSLSANVLRPVPVLTAETCRLWGLLVLESRRTTMTRDGRE